MGNMFQIVCRFKVNTTEQSDQARTVEGVEETDLLGRHGWHGG
jgi:hypothetical protein